MKKCSWCGKGDNRLKSVISQGIRYNICSECLKAYNKNVCRKCGETDNNLIKGLCLDCASEVSYEKIEELEELASGVEVGLLSCFNRGTEVTLNDLESLMRYGRLGEIVKG